MILLIGITVALVIISMYVNLANKVPNPFVVFVWLLTVVILTLIYIEPVPMFLIFVSLIITKLFVRTDSWKTYMRFALYMMLFIILLNILLVHTGTVLWSFWIIKITDDSIKFAYTMALRLLTMMGAFAIFNSNVSTDDMMLIFEKMRVPEKAYMTFVIAFRFFEVLSVDARESMLAFRARGIPVADSGLRSKIKYRYPVMMSLMKNSLNRAMDVAETLEVRGFPSGKRRSWHNLNLNARDKLALTCILLSIPLSFFSFRLGSWIFAPATLLPALLVVSRRGSL